ncbi:lactonase family protein [Bacteroidota bacterium]
MAFYLGTSDQNLKFPIKLCELDVGNNSLHFIDSFAGSISPSYINISPDKRFLFAGSRPSGNAEGSVNSYQINRETYDLNLINSRSSQGIDPTHLSVHPLGKSLFVANYQSGTVASFQLKDNGEILPSNANYQHKGSGPNENRQNAAHAHYIHSDPSGNYVLSADLGADKVYIYAYDNESGKIEPNANQKYIEMAPGAGPRHLVFHPSGNWFYVINELNSTLTACSFNKTRGEAKILKTISTLPDHMVIENFPAAIRIHPNGKFLYSSNRGHNSIALFAIHEEGIPELQETKETKGDWPRDFNIDPPGKYMIVANQRSNNLCVFAIDQENGKLKSLDIHKKTRQPTCVLFLN